MWKKLILWLTAIICLSWSNEVYADTKEIVELKKAGEFRVIFEYDKEKPDITFISPAGEKLREGMNNVTCKSGDGWVTYLIQNAQVGKWKLDYDKKSNQIVRYHVLESIDNIAIQYFEMEDIKENKAFVRFKVGYPEGGTYKYEISVIGVESFYDGKDIKIFSGNAKIGEEVEREINLSKISTGENYKLRLSVEMKDGELFDEQSTKAFSYKNPNEVDAISDYEVHLNRRNQTITLDWSSAKQGNAYEIQVTNKEGKKLFQDTTSEKRVIFPYTSEDKEMTAFISQKVGGRVSAPKEKKFQIDSEYGVEILNTDITSSSTGQIECKNDGKTKVKIWTGEEEIRGNEKEIEKDENIDIGEVEIEGNQVIDFPLNEVYTYIAVSMLAADGIYYDDSLMIYRDNIAPTIKLYENLDGATVKTASVCLVGETVSGAKLLLNEKEQSISEGGQFKVNVSLNYGENKIKLTAQDIAGNISEKLVTIHRVRDKKLSPKNIRWQDFIALFIALGVSVIIIIISLIFFKSKDGGKK